MSEIPEPKDTGSAGTQAPSTSEVLPAVSESPLEGLPLARAVEGLAATRPRSIGGKATSTLLAGSFAHLSQELQATKSDLHQTRNELNSAREELSTCKMRAAVLAERIRAHARGRHLKNVSITVGTALIGLAIPLFRNDLGKFALVVGCLGVLLISLGWFSTGGEAET